MSPLGVDGRRVQFHGKLDAGLPEGAVAHADDAEEHESEKPQPQQDGAQPEAAHQPVAATTPGQAPFHGCTDVTTLSHRLPGISSPRTGPAR